LKALLSEAAANTVMVVFGTGDEVGVAGVAVGVDDAHPATTIAINNIANMEIGKIFPGTMKSPPVL
jgi:putative aminopeptidase FrvX